VKRKQESKHLAIYYRVSTDKQDVESQKAEVEKWVAKLDPQPESVRVIEDSGISGSTTKRPGYQELLRLANEGEIDTIVCYKLDRFSRSANEAIRTLLDLDDKGVAFVSVTQAVLNLGHSNPFRRTILSAFAEISEIERETLIDRTKAGLAVARAKGKRLGRPPQEIAPDQIREAKQLKLKGLTYEGIAEKIGLSKTKVFRLLAA